jgi:hypothetical protein
MIDEGEQEAGGAVYVDRALTERRVGDFEDRLRSRARGGLSD